MRTLTLGCGALLVLLSAACAGEPEEPEIASGIPKPFAGVYLDYGPAPPATKLRALMSFPMRDPQGLERAVADIYDPTKPDFRKYMSVDTWMSKHAPLESELQYVEGWLLIYGMTVERTATNRMLVEFRGTVEQFNRAFKTELRKFERENPALGNPPIDTFGALKPLHVPPDIASHVGGVLAVDMLPDTDPLSPEGGDIQTAEPPDVGKAFTIPQIAHAYGLDNLYAEGHRGKGVKLGLIVGAGYKIKDLQSFWRSFGVSRDNPKAVPTMDPISTRYLETTLDAEWSGGLAPEADLIVYEGPDSLNTSVLFTFNEAIGKGEVSVLSTSFAHREETEAPSLQKQYSDSAMMGAALGMTIIAAGGDSGMPDTPSSGPYVTSVGGTYLKLNAGGDIDSEVAWSGSGSGPSSVFPIPAWQEGVVTDSGGKRAISDVSMNAYPGSYWLYFIGKWDHRGGTSFAAPAFAGLMAAVNSYRIANHAPVVGWLNPALYLTKPVQASFRDITASDGNMPLHPVKPGWDYLTGWGAPRADLLAKALP